MTFLAAAVSVSASIGTALPSLPTSPSGLLAALDSLLSMIQSPLANPLAGPLNNVLNSLLGGLPPISL